MGDTPLKPEALTNFGIRAISYKNEDAFIEGKTNLSTYLITEDTLDSSQLWIPQIFGTTRQPINWSMNYIVPKD